MPGRRALHSRPEGAHSGTDPLPLPECDQGDHRILIWADRVTSTGYSVGFGYGFRRIHRRLARGLGTLFEQYSEAVLVQDRHFQLHGLVELGARVVADHDE